MARSNGPDTRIAGFKQASATLGDPMLRRQPKKRQLATALGLEKLTECSSDLSRLLSTANQLSHYDQAFEQILPHFLQGCFHVNSISKSHLVLTCSSATMATRFRMTQKQVIEQLNRQTDLAIQHVKIKIRPGNLQSTEQRQTRRKLSKKNAQLLEKAAEQTEDQKLKLVLQKLAAHGDKQ